MRKTSRLIARHLGRPSGWLGWIVGRGLVKKHTFEAEWNVSLLDLQPGDRVLEIGFGPGVGVERALARVEGGTVSGVDCSEVMVQAARKRNAAAVRAGRADLRLGDVSQLPWPDATFTQAFTVHCIYFWKDPAPCLREIHRTLKAGGRLAVTIRPREQFPKVPADIFTLYEPPEVEQLLAGAGFREIRSERTGHPLGGDRVCILGRK